MVVAVRIGDYGAGEMDKKKRNYVNNHDTASRNDGLRNSVGHDIH